MAVSTSIELDDTLRGRVEHLAEIRRRTPDGIMRKAIAQYLDRAEKREILRQDTLKAWNEAQVTGLHATAEEVEHWSSRWGDANERPAPECHASSSRHPRFAIGSACA
ncbi:CopG family ribbon-helix-helix protein [Methylobacterium sp. J-088]|uniref:CopG family ribbon-helix-helix protein n=1 Tax=Methylobacterium sp. J-088 TaxID=2836664 RepID=UPI001FBB0127|nr:CopG family ribbon-helix-helix protein [Methylobacterium sp. J-088]MCJ2065004.1 CopG family ribbon-helix-helix protein [Methylobacterium sp. J-088]